MNWQKTERNWIFKTHRLQYTIHTGDMIAFVRHEWNVFIQILFWFHCFRVPKRSFFSLTRPHPIDQNISNAKIEIDLRLGTQTNAPVRVKRGRNTIFVRINAVFFIRFSVAYGQRMSTRKKSCKNACKTFCIMKILFFCSPFVIDPLLSNCPISSIMYSVAQWLKHTFVQFEYRYHRTSERQIFHSAADDVWKITDFRHAWLSLDYIFFPLVAHYYGEKNASDFRHLDITKRIKCPQPTSNRHNARCTMPKHIDDVFTKITNVCLNRWWISGKKCSAPVWLTCSQPVYDEFAIAWHGEKVD